MAGRENSSADTWDHVARAANVAQIASVAMIIKGWWIPAIMLFLALFAVGVGIRFRTHGVPLDSKSLDTSYRRKLLRQQEATWLENYLEPNLQATGVRLDVRVASLEGLVAGDFLPPSSSDTLSAALVRSYNGRLLVTGERGAGKTLASLTLLAELMEKVQRAAEPEIVPIFVDISAWRPTTRMPFYTWLQREVRSVYGIPTAMLRRWVAADDVIFILDDLTGTQSEDAIAERVRQMNTWLGKARQLSVIVSGQLGPYRDCGEELHLNGAVALQPLEPVQELFKLQQAGVLAEADVASLLDPGGKWHTYVENPLSLRLCVEIARAHEPDPVDWALLAPDSADVVGTYLDVQLRYRRTRPASERVETDDVLRVLAWMSTVVLRMEWSVGVPVHPRQASISWMSSSSIRRAAWVIRGLGALGVAAVVATLVAKVLDAAAGETVLWHRVALFASGSLCVTLAPFTGIDWSGRRRARAMGPLGRWLASFALAAAAALAFAAAQGMERRYTTVLVVGTCLATAALGSAPTSLLPRLITARMTAGRRLVATAMVLVAAFGVTFGVTYGVLTRYFPDSIIGSRYMSLAFAASILLGGACGAQIAFVRARLPGRRQVAQVALCLLSGTTFLGVFAGLLHEATYNLTFRHLYRNLPDGVPPPQGRFISGITQGVLMVITITVIVVIIGLAYAVYRRAITAILEWNGIHDTSIAAAMLDASSSGILLPDGLGGYRFANLEIVTHLAKRWPDLEQAATPAGREFKWKRVATSASLLFVLPLSLASWSAGQIARAGNEAAAARRATAASRLVAEGQLEEAERLYREAMELDPSTAHVASYCHAIGQAGDVEAAARLCEEMLEYEPSAVSDLEIQVYWSMQAEHFEAAAEGRRRLVLADPTAERATAYCTGTASWADDAIAKSACADALEYTDLDADQLAAISYAAWSVEAYGTAIEASRRALELDPSADAAARYCSAVGFAGQVDKAADTCESVLDYDIDSAYPLLVLGSWATQASRYERAAEVYLQAVEVEPSADNVSRYCNALGLAGDADGAADACEAILDYDIEGTEPLEVLAFWSDQAGRFDRAASVYQQVMEIAPSADTAADVCNALGKSGDVDGAADACEAVLDYPAETVWPYQTLIRWAGEADRTDLAIDGYRRIADLEQSAEATARLCDALGQSGDIEAAADACAAVMEFDDADVSSLLSLGYWSDRAGRFGVAADAYGRASAIEPTADTSVRLCRSLAMSGEDTAAKDGCREALSYEDLDPAQLSTVITSSARVEDVDGVVEAGQRLIELSPTSESMARYCGGLGNAGEVEAAADLCEHVLDYEITTSFPLTTLAYWSTRAERFERAITVYGDALEQFPSAFLAAQYCSAIGQSGDVAGAADACLAVLFYEIDETYPLERLGFWSVKAGRYEAAADAYRRIFELRPTARTKAKYCEIVQFTEPGPTTRHFCEAVFPSLEPR